MRCGVFEYNRGDAGKFAHQAAPALVRLFCVAALALGVCIIGAEAKKKPHPLEEPILDSRNGEPLTLVISLRDQKMDVYQGITLVTSTKVSTGTRSYPTKAGVFSILEKQRYHHSNMYSAAPMPWMQRLTWSGTALHGGVVPGYPASHGCIRLPFSFAPKLFNVTAGGENVVVAHDRPKPALIDHPVLFQPTLPAPIDARKQADANSTEYKVLDKASEDQSVDTAKPTTHEMPTEKTNDPLADPSDKSSTDNPVIVTVESSAPLRILVTRQTERDRIIDVQYQLASMGYLTPQKFTGRLGAETVAAIKAFQKANGMVGTGTFDDSLAKQIYKVAGKEEPAKGHLFVRQQFRPVFDVPVSLQNPEQSLGTHLFTALFVAGDTKSRWMAISLEGNDAVRVLDRIEIPTDIRQKIAEKLTPGSSLIVAEKSINSAILPEGGDFLVSANDAPVVAQKIKTKVVAQKPEAKPKHVRSAQAKFKRSNTSARSKTWARNNTLARRDTFASRNSWDAGPYGFNSLSDADRPRLFFRWRWRRCGEMGC
jgi:peptidoglycan hydrolase-like protein with peptidoglycan-binding domain